MILVKDFSCDDLELDQTPPLPRLRTAVSQTLRVQVLQHNLITSRRIRRKSRSMPSSRLQIGGRSLCVRVQVFGEFLVIDAVAIAVANVIVELAGEELCKGVG
jgi:hypothetical protein